MITHYLSHINVIYFSKYFLEAIDLAKLEAKLIVSVSHFNFDMPSTLWSKRARTFDIKFSASDNMFCKATAPSHAHSL